MGLADTGSDASFLTEGDLDRPTEDDNFAVSVRRSFRGRRAALPDRGRSREGVVEHLPDLVRLVCCRGLRLTLRSLGRRHALFWLSVLI